MNVGPLFKTGATSVPNQEKVINRAKSVTYHDNPANVRMILLPNGEIMQAHFALELDKSFGVYAKQEWELGGDQNGTILESGWPCIPFLH
jgi:hypothetical protein